MYGYGLKNVRQRRSDALTRIGWDRLESLMATYYRDLGYTVDHCGTGATGKGADGGIDLKLRKDDQYILVQCKHWNAKQVPHNDVHQLLGLMVNEGATGAILVTSGEFTAAAKNAAGKLGHVQLVDGDRLREMLGPLPEPAPTVFDTISLSAPRNIADVGSRIAAQAGERLLRATGDRIRDEGRRVVGRTARGLMTTLILKLVAAGLFLLLVWFVARALLIVLNAALAPAASPPGATQIQAAQVQPAQVQASTTLPIAEAQRLPNKSLDGCRELIDAPSGTYIDHCVERRPAKPTAAELKRRADEAARIIEASTPEM